MTDKPGKKAKARAKRKTASMRTPRQTPKRPSLTDFTAADQERLNTLFAQMQAFSFPDLPKLPDPETLDPRNKNIPRDAALIARYGQTEALHFSRDPNVKGVGLGLRQHHGKQTDELCLVVMVGKKLRPRDVPKKCLLPTHITCEGQEFRVDVQEFPNLDFRFMHHCPRYPRITGGCSGSAISVEGGDPCAGGTLTGTWRAQSGSRQRGMTCCHVSLGFGIDAFLANLPMSLLWLFDSPSGADIIASDAIQQGQNLHRLMSIDTPWPILVPFPMPIPVLGGAFAFILVDAAAGTIRPQAIPPFAGRPFSFSPTPPHNPPVRGSITQQRIRSARVALPGMDVTKVGQTTGQTWGNVALSFVQFFLPVPLGPFPLLIIFDQIISTMDIGPGDSGAALTTDDMNYLGHCWAGLPFGVRTGVSPANPGALCPITPNDVVPQTLSTPYYWTELLMNLDHS